MKEDWTKQMKQKLEGHKMTPPAGLWEAISNQMGLEPTPTPNTVCHFVGALSLILPQTARESVGLDHWESYDKEVRWRVLK